MAKKKGSFDPKERTDRIIQLCQDSYDRIYKDVERGIDEEATGSDRRNEITAIKDGIEALDYLVAKIASLQSKIDRESFTGEKKEWASRTEELNS
jgi:hypothetical protein